MCLILWCDVCAALRPVAAWTQWLTRLLLGSLYPGAPFERKFMAMLLLETLLATWNTPDKANRQNFRLVDNIQRPASLLATPTISTPAFTAWMADYLWCCTR